MSDIDPSLEIIREESPTDVCIFCKQTSVNELIHGLFYKFGTVKTHYFCLLFSSGLIQHGKSDSDGILGFLPADILKEVRRGQRLKCTYCNLSGATIGCSKKSCRTMFHYHCGRKNEANFQFLDAYEAYCINHKAVRPISFDREYECSICMEKVQPTDNAVQATCCKNAVFHHTCIQEMALSAGYYFFKCPACNSKAFVEEMKSKGIYVPLRDASWEKDPDAFSELYIQYTKCDSEDCYCEEGREYIEDEGNWDYARCDSCGAAGCHKYCGKILDITDWTCESCLKVINSNSDYGNPQPSTSSYIPPSCGPDSSSSESSDSDSDSEEDEEEEKVQAKKKKKESFDIRTVRIARNALSYFPYTRKIRESPAYAQEYKERGCLIDFRRKDLRVIVKDWIKTSEFTRHEDPNYVPLPVSTEQETYDQIQSPIQVVPNLKESEPNLELNQLQQSRKENESDIQLAEIESGSELSNKVEFEFGEEKYENKAVEDVDNDQGLNQIEANQMSQVEEPKKNIFEIFQPGKRRSNPSDVSNPIPNKSVKLSDDFGGSSGSSQSSLNATKDKVKKPQTPKATTKKKTIPNLPKISDFFPIKPAAVITLPPGENRLEGKENENAASSASADKKKTPDVEPLVRVLNS